jgi:predicted CoA-binding protein
MAGYSANPLFKKLSLKEGQRIRLINPPADYSALVGDGMETLKQVDTASEPVDFVHFFTNSRAELERRLPQLKEQIVKSGRIWISWYKKSAKKETELTENVIRDFALSIALVDVKVCAIDEQWSGLKRVFRLKDR